MMAPPAHQKDEPPSPPLRRRHLSVVWARRHLSVVAVGPAEHLWMLLALRCCVVACHLYPLGYIRVPREVAPGYSQRLVRRAAGVGSDSSQAARKEQMGPGGRQPQRQVAASWPKLQPAADIEFVPQKVASEEREDPAHRQQQRQVATSRHPGAL